LPETEKATIGLYDGWGVATPASQGVNPTVLFDLYERLDRGDYPGVDGVVIIRNGILVSERYFGSYDLAKRHDTRSTFKSVTGLITGIAIDHGVVKLDDPVAPLIAEFHELTDRDPRKQQITFQDLLEMRSGLDCSEMPGKGPHREKFVPWRWVAYNWEIPMQRVPGTEWHYCSANIFLLGVALTAALEPKLGMDIRDFAHTFLFEPLQIEDYQVNSVSGHMTTQGSGYFRPRDLAKFGQLVLSQGSWQAEQLVSKQWISVMTSARVTTDWSWTHNLSGYSGTEKNAEYGYQWFRTILSSGDRDYLVIHSWGNGGQFIFVIPELNLVTVVTGSNYGYVHIERQRQVFNILAQFVIPATNP
jgi:CubicO group peptidase (beta-lactamase class C family)